jgi:hypothetical protein
MPNNTKEVRALRAKEIRVAKAEDGSRTLSGIVTYNTPSVDLGGFTEILAPGCFSDSITGDVLMLRDHDTTLLMGRTKSGTLKLADTADGLQFDCLLPNTTSGNDLAESVNRGDLDGCSFGFITLDDSWAASDTETVRTITKAELLEVSPCSWAAYPANSVSLRSCPAELRSAIAQRNDPEADSNEDGTADACKCQCDPCLNGNCADCTDDPCDCEGCTCNEHRCLRAMQRLVFRP